MAHRLVVTDNRAWAVLAAQAEGMAEVQDDNGDAELANAFERVMVLAGSMHETPQDGEGSIEIPDDLVEAVKTVLENCLDVSTGTSRADDPEWEDQLLYADEARVEEIT
jgi:DNA-binding transcriptional regulator/RsmH inhibitor MraZ